MNVEIEFSYLENKESGRCLCGEMRVDGEAYNWAATVDDNLPPQTYFAAALAAFKRTLESL